MNEHTAGSIRYLSFGIFDRFEEVTCISTTRGGGTSAGPFASLNLGGRSGDDPAAVRDNRAQLSMITGGFPDLLTFGRQVHGTRVAVVEGNEIGSGGLDPGTAIPDTDALATCIPDVPLVVLVADCCAVTVYDPANRAVGVAHAGWRGTVGGIASALVDRMSERFGTDPGDLIAGVGPSIGRCCYEVGGEVEERFTDAWPDLADCIFERGDGRKTRLDLPEANRLVLVGAGVGEDNIETAGLCSACRTDWFYSHRAEHGNTGRFGVLIMLHDRTARAY
jgi:YfiH family protein